MSIQLISVSHKTADLSIRSCFALTRERQIEYMKALKTSEVIEECAVLATCNRLEIYIYGRESHQREIFSVAETLLFQYLELPVAIDGAEYLRFYEGTRAVRHLFRVASGLDSMVMGEDQILGQVKDAQNLAVECGCMGTCLNTCFRYAVTAAKKVKTDTDLSRTSVSTATIAVKAAKEYLGDLKEKNILVIGASGKIGNTVYKNFATERKTRIYATVRPHHHLENKDVYYEIPYDERYDSLDYMDVIISATASPHYTLTVDKVRKALKTEKPRVFIDLAVPPDIDRRVAGLPKAGYYNIDDFAQIAGENNRKKLAEADAAKEILEAYQIQFEKWMIFQKYFSMVRNTKAQIGRKAEEKGMDRALNQFFFALRECMTPDQLEAFMKTLTKVGEIYEKD